ncbi:MAG: RagB/SusD family nutrient uptake outer membrane protein [Bacteroidales bacterium]|nr:RagB/SusD family nutrient uptake outer membrane protein [Bacteroidales bacterium]
MKKIFVISIFASIFILSSCNDFLDKTPDNRASLNSPKAVRELLVSAYPDQTYQVFTETMTDNVSDRGAQANELSNSSPSKIFAEQAYYWKDMKGDDQDSPTAYWTGCYNAIAACNHALEAIKKNGDGPEYAAAKGEALICRAYAHFMLVNIFAEHYDPTTAATALGIPYVTEPEKVVFQTYQRNTIKEVYDHILSDFTTGFPLIDDANYTIRSYHFTKKASAAFASRLYLYLNQPDSVIKYSDIVLGGNPISVIRDWNGIYKNFSSSDAISTQYDKGDDPSNILLIGCTSWLSRAIYNRFGLTFDLMNSLGRKVNVTGGKNAFSFYGSSTSNFVFIPKYMEYFKRESINANYGIGYVMIPSFTTDEVLLNRAEAFVMKNDLTNTLNDINIYYSKRISGYNTNAHSVTDARILAYANNDATAPAPFYSISGTQMPYVKVLLDIRRAEFIHEGLRWFDIKRMHLAVKHDLSTGEPTPIVLTPNDLRRAVQIPSDALTFGIKPNGRDITPAPSIILPN